MCVVVFVVAILLWRRSSTMTCGTQLAETTSYPVAQPYLQGCPTTLTPLSCPKGEVRTWTYYTDAHTHQPTQPTTAPPLAGPALTGGLKQYVSNCSEESHLQCSSKAVTEVASALASGAGAGELSAVSTAGSKAVTCRCSRQSTSPR